jgi:ADP-heptose:LPS heptosyltransferase
MSSIAEPTPGRETADAVLVLRALGLGDALTGIPALRGIRRAWPNRFIVLAAPPAIGCWLRDIRIVDEVLPTVGLANLDWPPAGWIGIGGHIAVNLHGNGPQSHRLLNATAPDALIAFRSQRGGHLSGPEWRPREHEVDRWCRLVSSAGGPCDAEDLRLPEGDVRQQHIILHPGAASASRRWPVNRWGRLAAELRLLGCRVSLTGGHTEHDLCAAVMTAANSATGHLCLDGDRDVAGSAQVAPIGLLAGSLELGELADIIRTAGLVVSGDTGVAHLATASGTRSVVLFGPTAPALWGPTIDQDLHTVIWHGDPNHPGDPHGDHIDPALADITVDEVIAAATAQLSAAGFPAVDHQAARARARRAVPVSGQTNSPFATSLQAS